VSSERQNIVPRRYNRNKKSVGLSISYGPNNNPNRICTVSESYPGAKSGP
jgi:hypothetical protein